MPLPAFIPLREAAGDGAGRAQQQQQQLLMQQSAAGVPVMVAVPPGQVQKAQEEEEGGETLEELALRRIRDLNAATRDTPQDVGLWLRYADFQDEAFLVLGKG